MQSTAVGVLDCPELQRSDPLKRQAKWESMIFSKNADGNTVVIPNPYVLSCNMWDIVRQG